MKIKQYSEVTYLGCILDESLSRKSIALNVVSKNNTRLKFLHRKKQIFVTSIKVITMHCKKFKTKLQTLQNKYVRFCLQLDNRVHVGITEFKKINWLPVDYRFRRCLAANAFKFFDDRCPLYMKDIFEKSCISTASTRNSTIKLS